MAIQTRLQGQSSRSAERMSPEVHVRQNPVLRLRDVGMERSPLSGFQVFGGGGAERAPRRSSSNDESGGKQDGTSTVEMLRRNALQPMTEESRLLPGLTALHLLIIDEDEPVLRAISEIAAEMGFAVHAASNAEAAQELLDRASLDVVLLDLRSGGVGLPLLERVRVKFPRVPIVVMTAFATVNSAVEAMRLGASDYLTKPFAMDELTVTLRNAAQRRQFDVESRRLQERLQRDPALRGVIGGSPEMEKLLRIVSKVAFANHPVLIGGESGTGKEMIAKLIHANAGAVQVGTSGGKAAERPFLSIDCRTEPAVVETELFGYVKGDGTPEREERAGLLAVPGGGTLFLEEIGELSPELQGRLLRAMQDKQVRRPGVSEPLPMTVRVLASTSRNLPLLVESGGFRKDLYFRLNVVNLRIPPLRERRGDISLLAMYFLEKRGRERGIGYSLDGTALRLLTQYDWPGNVRELEAVIERACSISSGPVLHVSDLPTQLQGQFEWRSAESVRVDARSYADRPGGDGGAGLKPAGQAGFGRGGYGQVGSETNVAGAGISGVGGRGSEYRSGASILPIAEMEKQAILTTIRQLNGDKLMAAKLLGIGKTTLYRKLKEYGIEDV